MSGFQKTQKNSGGRHSPDPSVATRARESDRRPVHRAQQITTCPCGGGCPLCEKQTLQRKAAGPATPTPVPPIVHEVLGSAGHALTGETRSVMESRFGRSFADVRIHTDGRAAESAKAVRAHAYTVGHDVVFGKGRWTPDSRDGERLLAHELTHVVQQSQSAPPGDGILETAPSGTPAEAEAERVSRGVPGTTSSSDSAPSVQATSPRALARESDEEPDALYTIYKEMEKAREEEEVDFKQAQQMFRLTGKFIFLHRFAPIEIRTGQRISRVERHRQIAYMAEQRVGQGGWSAADELAYARERLTDPDLELFQATRKFNFSSVNLGYVRSTFEKPAVSPLGGLSKGYYKILKQLDNGQDYEVSEASVKEDLLLSVDSVSGPITIDTPYSSEKDQLIVIRYPMDVTLKNGETRRYVFEIWWFAAGENEFNYLQGFAEMAANVAKATPDMWAYMPVADTLNYQLGVLLRPIVGDAILYQQMKKEAVQMVVSGVSTLGANAIANKIQNRSSGTPPAVTPKVSPTAKVTPKVTTPSTPAKNTGGPPPPPPARLRPRPGGGDDVKYRRPPVVKSKQVRGATPKKSSKALVGRGGSRDVTPKRRIAATPPRPVELVGGMKSKLDLSDREEKFLVDNAQTYKEEMNQRAHITNPKDQSNEAHVAAEKAVLKRWPDAVKERNALTGVTGPGTTGPRQADTALRLTNPAKDKPARDIVIDYKKTAFIEKPSMTLRTAGYDKQNKIETDQIQAYEVAARQLKLRVFITNERGEVFTPNPSGRGWIKIAGPSS